MFADLACSRKNEHLYVRMVPVRLPRIALDLPDGRSRRTGQTDAFSVWLQRSVCVSIEASIPLSLARHKLKPLLLSVNDHDALEPHPEFVDHPPVDSSNDFASIGHFL